MAVVRLLVISLCLVLAFGKLHPIVETNYDTDFVFNCIQNLHKQHKFNTFIIYTNTREETMPKAIVVPPIERELQQRLGVPVIIWSKHGGLLQSDVIGSNNMVIVFINDISDPILMHIDEALWHQHSVPMVFVFRRIDLVTPTASERHTFFEWCWLKKMPNTLLIYEELTYRKVESDGQNVELKVPRVFTYNPFPRVHVHELSESLCSLKSISNVMGHKFRLPYLEHAPTTFLSNYTDNKLLEKPTITGVLSRLLTEYINHINGTSVPVLMKNISIEERRLMTARGEVDIGIMPISSLKPFPNATFASAPIGITNACVIVPVIQEMPLSTYLANFIFGKGNIICLLTVPLIVLFKYLTQRERSLWNLLFETFALFISQAGSVMPFRNLPPSTKILHLAYLIWSMLVLSVYIGGMTSLLSARSDGHQIETVEEFLETDLEILLQDGYKQILFDTGLLPANLVPRLHIVDIDTFAKHVSVLNTSFAYVVLKEYWGFVALKQAHLTIPRFRIASDSMCTPQFVFKYPMQSDSPYLSSLNEFILRTSETGLSHQWIKDIYYQAKKMGLLDILPINESQALRPLTMGHFSDFFLFYFCCIGVSVLVFIAEIIIHKLRN